MTLDNLLLHNDNIPTLLDWDRIQKQVDEAVSKIPEKNVHVKGSRIDDLNAAFMFIPLKLRKACRKLSSGVESALRGSLEKIGVAFSVGGAAFVAMPATVFNTFATNAFFFVGDIFLLSIFTLEKRYWLIVQNTIFAILAAWGIINNFQGVL
ncbi:MAG: hypothetical protein M0R03_19365 [Novosphingobium sp.]|nr:hypothetical protein [Novosphingobium sp.]